MTSRSLSRGRRTQIAASLTCLLLAACGGGGDSAPQSVTFQGVAATGAPMAGANLVVTDSRGVEVCITEVGNDGRYSCTLESEAQAPFALSATLDEQRLFSVTASAASGTVNVTPLTNLIVARLAPGGDPARLAAALQADPAMITDDKLKTQVDEVKALLAPVLEAIGDTVDPLHGSFGADGTGHDKVLDSLQVTIRPEADSSNIEITVKVRPSRDDAAPIKISFKSGEKSPPPLTAPIDIDDLAETGIGDLLEDFMQRATACYALPLAQRVAGDDAAAVKAAECKDLFIDSDPSKYKDNGQRVGADAEFATLFSDGSTGLRFDRPTHEYLWSNGDLQISYRTTGSDGGIGWVSLTVHKQDGKLRAMGNQYVYRATVRPYVADREFLLQPKFSWFGTGYNAAVYNQLDPATGLPLFKEAYVTAPDGRRSIYRPLPGRSNLGVYDAVQDRQRVASVQFFGAAYQDPSTPGNPATKTGGIGGYFVSPQLDDKDLRALPEQGVWHIEWVHADGSKANVKQSYRTIGRAPTIAEVRQLKFVQFTEAFKAELKARSDVVDQGGIFFGAPSAQQPNVVRFATADGGDGWVVPEGAAAPTRLTVIGDSATEVAFNDFVDVPSTSRKGSVTCSPQSAEDDHCDSRTGVAQFALNASIGNLEMHSVGSRQQTVQKAIILDRLPD